MIPDCIRRLRLGLSRVGVRAVMMLGLCPVGVNAMPPELRIGYTEFPPYEYQDANGEAAGSYIDLTRQVAIDAGYRPRFIYLPISRLYLYLKEGRIDLWPGLTDIPKLQGEVLASEAKPLHIELSAWHRAAVPPIRHFDELRNRRLILISGYTYGGLAQFLSQQSDIDLTYTSSHGSGMDMLERDRGDYLLDYREPVEALRVSERFEGLNRSFIRERVGAWLFACQHDVAIRYRADFDAAYARLRDQNRLPFPEAATTASELPGFPVLPVSRVPAKVMSLAPAEHPPGLVK